ncbi:MAG: hypothetical protein WCO02_04350 [Bacteroidota bacterium]
MKTLRILFLFLLVSGLSSPAFTQSKSKKKLAGYTIDNYEIECVGVGSEGTKLWKVWGYGKKPDVAILQAKRNAVHAAIFKGAWVGKCPKTEPLVSDPAVEENNQEYFDKFFENGGTYLSFVALSGDGMEERVKVGKQYKVAIVVSVMYAQLRKELERAGIVKSLNNGF